LRPGRLNASGREVGGGMEIEYCKFHTQTAGNTFFKKALRTKENSAKTQSLTSHHIKANQCKRSGRASGTEVSGYARCRPLGSPRVGIIQSVLTERNTRELIGCQVS
jgi:hypothetical protein